MDWGDSMSFSIRSYWLVTTALASAPYLFSGSMAHAACAPDPAGYGATVVCSGTDVDGFNSSANELDITIEEGAIVDSPSDRAFDLAGTGNFLTNNGDIVGSVRGYYSSTFSSIVNNGSITAFASERAAIYSYSGYQDVFIENNGNIILNDNAIAIFGWGQANITNNGIISGDGPYAQGISVDLFDPFTPNTITNNGVIDVNDLALNVGGSVTIQNTGILTNVFLDGFSITPKPYAIEMTNHASGSIHGGVRGDRSVSLSNAGVIDGDVVLTGNDNLYRSIGGTLSGNLSFGSGHDTFLVSLDFEGAPLGVSGVIDPGLGRDAAGYTTTGIKSVSYGLFDGFEVVAAEADGEDARLTITSDQTESGAIRLFGTGTIINEVDFIHPDDIGLPGIPSEEVVIDIWGPYTHVENHASIISGTGIYGKFGAGSILNTGTISSINAGIYSERASGVAVRNSGTIEVTGTWGYSIYLSEFWSNYQQLAPEGDADTIVENTGVITSDSTSAIYIGQKTASAQVSVLNSGSISTDGIAVEAVGIFAWGNVRVENSGVISTTGADSTVLSIDSDDSVIINTGTLQSQEAGANVIFTEFADSTIIQNSGTISLLGGGSRTRMLCYGFICYPQQRIPVDYLTEAAAAITIQAREGTVTNEAGGVIEAVGEGSTAILVDVSLASQTTIVNAGIIRGPADSIIDDTPLAGAIQGSDAVEIIDNSGSIIGNIDLAGGDDRFILRNLGTVEGDTQGGDDFDTLVIDTDSDTSVDLSRFLSFEAFEKRGNGTTELNGDAAFDSVEILGGRLTFGQGSDIAIPAIEIAGDGTLTVNGSLSTDVTVGADATLGGSGAINGNVTNNGTLSPGNSPGILTVNGDYAQGAAGTLTIEIVQSASPLTPVAGVDYDRLAVNGALSLDGTLLFNIAPAVYANGAAYDIATAVDGITGDFATISGLPTQGFVSFSGAIVSDPAVSATANNVYRWTVSRRAYASAALTPNEMATATAFTAALGSAYAAPASDTANVLATLDGMPDVDARSLFAATNGEFYGSFLTAGQDISDLFLRTLQLRARSGLAGGWL